MATVTELVDLVCEDTGLNDADPSDERSLALRRLNHAYRRIIQQYGGYTQGTDTPFELALASGDYDVCVTDNATLSSRFHSIRSVHFTADGSTISDPLPQVSLNSIRSQQNDNVTGAPTQYAWEYPNIYVNAPGGTDGLSEIHVYCNLMPLILVESGAVGGTSEATPTAVPPAFHESVLAKLAIVLVMEGYDGREQDAEYHRRLFTDALIEYRGWRVTAGGVSLPNDPTSVDAFRTPGRIDSR